MPPRDWRERVTDMLRSVESIRRFTDGLDHDRFAAEERTVAAVLYQLVVLGEAASALPDEVAAAHPDVPWKQMRQMRNVVAHGYFGVDLRIIWETVQRDLPALEVALRSLVPSDEDR